jgi:hypothetical protein
MKPRSSLRATTWLGMIRRWMLYILAVALSVLWLRSLTVQDSIESVSYRADSGLSTRFREIESCRGKLGFTLCNVDRIFPVLAPNPVEVHHQISVFHSPALDTNLLAEPSRGEKTIAESLGFLFERLHAESSGFRVRSGALIGVTTSDFKADDRDPRVRTRESNLRVTIPIWLPLLVCLLPGVIRMRRALRRRLRANRGCCLHCGYDLRGTPHTCPECGRRPT